MVRPNLDAETEKLARTLGSLKSVSLEEFNRLLHDNHVDIADTLLELDALTTQLDCYANILGDVGFTTAVDEARAALEECAITGRDWEARKDALERTLKVGTEVRTDDMSSVLESIQNIRGNAKIVGKTLRILRKKGQFLLFENDEKRQIDEKFLHLADTSMIDPDYASLLQSKFVYGMYLTRKRPEESAEASRIRQKQITQLLLKICSKMRIELHGILKEANTKVGAHNYCLDEAQDLTYRIPIHLSNLDDIITAKNHVVDDAMPQYHQEILDAVSKASEEFRDVSLEGRMFASFISSDGANFPDPTMEFDNNEQNDTTAIVRNKQYADFLQYNLGFLPFPPLKRTSSTVLRRPSSSTTKTDQLHYGAKLKEEEIIKRI